MEFYQYNKKIDIHFPIHRVQNFLHSILWYLSPHLKREVYSTDRSKNFIMTDVWFDDSYEEDKLFYSYVATCGMENKKKLFPILSYTNLLVFRWRDRFIDCRVIQFEKNYIFKKEWIEYRLEHSTNRLVKYSQAELVSMSPWSIQKEHTS